MKKILLISSFLLALACAAAAGDNESKRTWDYKNFTDILNRCAVNIEIMPGAGYKIRAEGDLDYIENLEIELNGKEIEIDYKRPGLFNTDRPKGTVIYIGLPSVSAVRLKGSGDVKIFGTNKSDGFAAEIGGSGDFYCEDMFVDSLSIEQNGSGAADFNQKVESGKARIRLRGSGFLDIKELVCTSIDISAGGSGDIRINMLTADNLESSLEGSGGLELGGIVKKLNHSGTGSSRLEAKELISSNARIKLTGSGRAELSVADRSEVWLWTTGSGTIDIYGNPIVQEQKRIGSGHINIH